MNTIKRIIVVFVLIVCTLSLAQANENNIKDENRITKEKDFANITYFKSVNIDYDFAAFYEKKISLINEIAKKTGLKKYKLDPQSLDVSRGGYGRDSNTWQVSVSLSIEFVPNYKGINALIKESGANSITIYRKKHEVCDDKK